MSEHEIHEDGSIDERAFAIHVLIGMLVGLPVFTAAIVGFLQVTTEQEMDSIVGIAVWSGIWVALFLGGGMGAGLWLLRNDH